MKVVMHQDASGAYVFQTGIDIADADRDFALKTMARAGALLFQKVFFGPAAGDDSKRIGSFLREAASDPAKRLKLQIVAETAPIPWGLLYVGDASAGATLDWDLFIGMRHVDRGDSAADEHGGDRQRDRERPAPGGQRQRQQRHRRAARRHLRRRHQRLLGQGADGEQARRRDVADDERRRHARPRRRGDRRPDPLLLLPRRVGRRSAIPADRTHRRSSSPTREITLADLNLDAPTTTLLRGKPLVFINACESAELSPAFYDGFVPYFMAKGARGVVGTQCKTPALFAAEWAQALLRALPRRRRRSATAFLDLRREFLDQHGNPLGLLYAVHCDGDTQDRAGARLAGPRREWAP